MTNQETTTADEGATRRAGRPLIIGLAMGWSPEVTLERAVQFAAAVCTVSGATTKVRRLYSMFDEQGSW